MYTHQAAALDAAIQKVRDGAMSALVVNGRPSGQGFGYAIQTYSGYPFSAAPRLGDHVRFLVSRPYVAGPIVVFKYVGGYSQVTAKYGA